MSTVRDLPKAPRMAAMQFLRDPYAFVTEAPARYGDLFLLDLGLTRVAIVSHPLHIAQILRERAKNYPKEGSMWDALRKLLGDGLVSTPTNEHWLKHRRMMQPHFHLERLAALTEKIAESVEEVVKSLDQRTRAPVNMNTVCAEMTMSVMVRAMFGTAMDDEDVPSVTKALKYVQEYLVRGMVLQAIPEWVPLPGRRQFTECVRTIDNVVYKTIERRRNGTKGDDLLTMLLEMVDAETGTRMSNLELRDEVITLLLAGYETTANAVAWAFYELAHRPEMAQRIRDEAAEVTGGERPGWKHISKLSYTRMFLKETLRRYPIGWQVMRTAVEDDVLGDVRVPAGTQMMLSFCGSHAHPTYWPDPGKFDPMRFTPDQEKARPKEAWMPFGAGQRICIGNELAMLESSLILPLVLRRYKLSPVPGRVAKRKVTFVLTTTEGMWLDLKPLN